MKNLFFASILLLAFSFGCEEGTIIPQDIISDYEALPPLGEGEEENISFRGPRVGQKSKYLSWTAKQGRDGNNLAHFAYSTDTLTAELVSRTNNIFTMEVTTSNSDALDTYTLADKKTSVVIKLNNQEEANFNFMAGVELEVADIEDPLVAGDYENYTNQTCEAWPCIATISNYEQRGKTYANLNTYADFTPMLANKPGLYAFYRGDLGYVRWAQLSAVGVHRGGWDLVIEE